MTPFLVQVVKLHSGESVDRQIAFKTAHLPSGSRVRVKVGKIRSSQLTGAAWHRPELIWQFETEEPDVLTGWHKRLEELGAQ